MADLLWQKVGKLKGTEEFKQLKQFKMFLFIRFNHNVIVKPMPHSHLQTRGQLF